jgi:hypothetical protein
MLQMVINLRRWNGGPSFILLFRVVEGRPETIRHPLTLTCQDPRRGHARLGHMENA